MERKRIIALIVIMLVVLTSCTQQQPPTPAPAPAEVTSIPPSTPSVTTQNTSTTQLSFKELHFNRVGVQANKPRQIQFVFSLRDENDHAIADIPIEDIRRSFRISENGEELDYDETNYFVNTAESFSLEVVFVLDFTASMAKAEVPGYANGIDAMVKTFIKSLYVLPRAHRIGVVEFHDVNVEPRVLSYLTTNRASVKRSVENFHSLVNTQFIPGFSRVWDSFEMSSELFSNKPYVTKALVVLTDGHDTSSTIERDQAFGIAVKNNIQVYTMGVGEVYQEDALRNLVLDTGGGYYSAKELDELPGQLKNIVNDLRGQYKLSFITGRRQGLYRFKLALAFQGAGGEEVLGEWTSEEIDVGEIDDYDTIGQITSDPPDVNNSRRTASIFIRALHVPREIRHIRFRLNTEKPIQITILPEKEGGLLEGWILSGPDEKGFYDVSSQQSLAFGNFGLLFRLNVSSVTEQDFEIPIEFDNSIYGNGECGKERRCFNYVPQGSLGVSESEPGPVALSDVHLTIHMRVDDPELPWSDVRIGQALALAINRQAIIEETGVTINLRHGKELWLDEYLNEYNIGRAKELLAEAGYPDGFSFEIVCLGEQMVPLSLVANYFVAIGVNLALQSEDPAVLESIWENDTWEQMFVTDLAP